MANNKQATRSTTRTMQQAALLIVLYIVLIFAIPVGNRILARHHFSLWEYRTVLFAISLPALVTWLVAFAGYAKLREYAASVKKTPEGKHFDKLATGSAWLAWSLAVTAIMNLAFGGLVSHSPGFYKPAVIISNYVNLAFSLLAFGIIGNASRGLINRAKLGLSLGSVRSIIVIFLVAGVSYCYLTFRNFDLSSLGSAHNPYFLPVWLMVVSVMIPYLYAWFAGLLAAYEIHIYSKHINGVLYRQALRLLAVGLIIIIVSAVALQYTYSLHPRIEHLVLGYRLVLSSTFRIIGAVGFILLGVGAFRLKKIEEV